ncbi:MAG: Stage 0 sporulation A-like protein [uncultured Clostridium sp.]
MKQKKIVKILVVDDEESIVNFLTMGLKSEGYEVYEAYDGKKAIEMAKEIQPDIVILDVMLPEVDGYKACEEIKNQVNTVVIMLTAREDIDDRIKGLDLGADDYMIKPFSYRELVARIRVRLRSRESIITVVNEVNLGNFKVNEDAHEITYKNEALTLSLTEYNLLKYLLDNKGIVLSKSKILDNVWGYDFFGDDNVVEVYIRYLRNKLNDKEHKIISNIRGVGYKINVEEE